MTHLMIDPLGLMVTVIVACGEPVMVEIEDYNTLHVYQYQDLSHMDMLAIGEQAESVTVKNDDRYCRE